MHARVVWPQDGLAVRPYEYRLWHGSKRYLKYWVRAPIDWGQKRNGMTRNQVKLKQLPGSFGDLRINTLKFVDDLEFPLHDLFCLAFISACELLLFFHLTLFSYLKKHAFVTHKAEMHTLIIVCFCLPFEHIVAVRVAVTSL